MTAGLWYECPSCLERFKASHDEQGVCWLCHDNWSNAIEKKDETMLAISVKRMEVFRVGEAMIKVVKKSGENKYTVYIDAPRHVRVERNPGKETTNDEGK